MRAVWRAAVLALSIAGVAQGEDFEVTYEPPTGVVAVGELATVTLRGPTTQPVWYHVKENGTRVVAEGEVAPSNTVQASLPRPGAMLVEFFTQPGEKSKVIRTAGLAAAPEALRPAAEAPADFAAFWESELAKLKRVPPNAEVTPIPSGKDGVDYAIVTLDNIEGHHVRAQLARPTGTGKLPAMVVYQWAGVYALDKSWVTGPAADGWLVLNVSAHDLPVAEAPEFYKAQSDGPLKNYVAIGAGDRQTSYFRTMLLGDYQAIEYLTSRSDWDGSTLVVRGASQGGLQAIAMAGLHPKVTALAALVPAGCDTLGQQAGRQPGWPYWFARGEPVDHDKIMNTSRFFDASNFARHVSIPALVGVGLRDTTSPPAGVFGMYNTLGGEKEVVVNPDGVHQSAQPKYEARQAVWLNQQRDRTSGPRGPATRPAATP